MTNNTDTTAGRKLRAVCLAFIMVVSVLGATVAFSGMAAAQSIGNSGSVTDIPGGNADETQDLSSGASSANDIVITGLGGGGNVQHAIKIDVSDLESAGVDISDVGVASAAVRSGTVDFTNFDSQNSEIQLVVTDPGNNQIKIEELQLTGLNTSNVGTATGLTYDIRVDDQNNGDFDDGSFTTDTIIETNSFSISSIEVENTATGNSVTETDIVAALNEADDPTSGDLNGGSSGDQMVVRLNEGTSVLDTNDLNGNGLSDNNIRIQPLNGADVTIENSGDGASTLDVGSTTGVKIQNITFSQADNNQVAVDVDDDGELTVERSTFTNGGTLEYVTATDDATLSIRDSVLEDDDNTADGIQITDGGETNDEGNIEITDTEFNGLTRGINANDLLTNGDGLASFSTEDNTFASNTLHVFDDTNNPQISLDQIFDSNQIEKFAIVTNDDDGTITDNNEHRIYGDLDQVNTGDIDTADTTTTVSAGDHSLGSRIGISGDDIDLAAASGTSPENVTIDVTTDPALQIGGDIDGLTINGLTFDTEGRNILQGDQDQDRDEITDLTITNNRFVNIQSATDGVIDLSNDGSPSNAPVLLSGNINDNVFQSAASDGNGYEAIDIDDIDERGSNSVEVNIESNVIDGANDGGISVDNIDPGDNANDQISLTVFDNDIEVTGANTGIDLSGLDSNDEVEIVVEENTLEANNAGTATGISVSASGSAVTDVSNNDISNFSATDGTGLDSSEFNQNGLTIEGNTLDNNGQQIDFDSSQPQDGESLVSDNSFVTLVQVLDSEGGSLSSTLIHGTLDGALESADNSQGDFIELDAGTYSENSLDFQNDDQTIAAADAGSVVIEPDTSGNPVFDITNDNDNVEIRGVTVDSSETDVGTTDVSVDTSTNTNDVTLNNIRFVGADDRTAIVVDQDDAASTVRIEDSDISTYSTGIRISSADDAGDVEIVRNQITDSALGIDVQDTSVDSASIGFNSIVNNDIGVESDEGSEVSAIANWWGDPSGPSGENPSGTDLDGDGDQFINEDPNSVTLTPFLDEPAGNLPTDRYVVVTDPRNPIADDDAANEPNAEVAVAVLNDSLATNTDDTETRLISDPSGPISGAGSSDSGTAADAADPLRYADVESSESGDFTFTAQDTDGDVPRGSSTQTYSGQPDGIEVTVERDTLVADGTTTVNATVQVIDQNGDDVSLSGEDVEYLIDNSSNADVTRERVETTTDIDGQAEVEISADNPDFELTITALFDEDDTTNAGGSSASATVTTTLNELSVSTSPSAVTVNDATDVTVEVTDASDQGIEDANIELSGSGVTQSLLTNSSGIATTTVNASSTGTIDVNVSAGGFTDVTESISVEDPEAPPTATVTFDNQTVQNGSTSVDVASATFNGSEDFVIVVHRASPGDNGIVDGTDEIGNKIGSSDVLTDNDVSDVPVDLTKNLDEGGNTQLTENQTLIAMLHFANESGDTNFGSPIVRDGTPVFDQADIGIGSESPLDGPAGEFDADADGDIDIGELGNAGTAFAQGELTIAELGEIGAEFAS